MQVTPRGAQHGRRGKREPVIVTQIDPQPVELTDAERKRRLFNRGW